MYSPCKAHVLSPLLSSSVVDSPLRKMQESEVGLSNNQLPADLLHITDDIRALTNSWDNLNALITYKVYTYAGSNGLKLNVEKREIFAARRCASSLNEFKTEENKISVKGAIKSIWHLGDQRQCGCAWIRIHVFKKSEEYSLLLRALAFFQSILLHQETCVKRVCSLYSYTAASTGLLTTN